MKVLAVNVALRDPETHSPVVFEAGTVPPKWALAEITNAKAWTSGQADVKPAETPPAAPVAAPEPSKNPSAVVEKPPSGGEGSGLDHWKVYAEHLGIDVPETATRGDVITLVEVFESDQK